MSLPNKNERSNFELFRNRLENMIDAHHELVKLSRLVDWQNIDRTFGAYFVPNVGRPAVRMRLMVGILYLKYLHNLSDEQVVLSFCENPYWQYFCGEEYFQHALPIHPTSLTKFRNRIGENGSEILLKETIELGLKTAVIKKTDIDKINIDTTVQPKAIKYPTDSGLQHQCRNKLVKLCQKHGIKLRQNYTRLSKFQLLRGNRYAFARQLRRATSCFKKIKIYLGRVYRDIERKLINSPHLTEHFSDILLKAKRLIYQKRDDKSKLYSLHAPEVECIAKGKVQKKYEFGSKVSIATTSKSNFVIGIQSLDKNKYDGHSLNDALDQVNRLASKYPKKVFVDQGYRGHKISEVDIHICGKRRGAISNSLRRDLKRRSAIEPIIGHLKSDGSLGRNHLKGTLGDKINAIMTGASFNLRKILKKLRFFYFHYLFQLIYTNLRCLIAYQAANSLMITNR